MRLIRTSLLYVLPIAFGLVITKYGFQLDDSWVNFTW
jgi:hypothetical protein